MAGSTLEPVAGCPSDGPTVCLSSEGTAREALVAHRDAFAASSEGGGGALRRRTAELVDLYTGEHLRAGLRRARDRADGGSLQITADPRVPFGVVAHIVSDALFETDQSDDGPAEVRDRAFEYLYLETES